MEMPRDWGDAGGWDRYYEAHPLDFETITEGDVQQVLRYYMAARNSRTWISGCGLEIAPWILSHLGCRITATDLSPVAVRMQKELSKVSPLVEIPALIPALKEKDIDLKQDFVEPEIFCSDFRVGRPPGAFGLVMNRQALQNLGPEDIGLAAMFFYKATVAGGVFVSETMNVQGEQRTVMENALIQAGYVMPEAEAAQWLRKQLDDSGLQTMMILGRPVILPIGEASEEDQELVDDLMDTYRMMRKKAMDKFQAKHNPEVDKEAFIIYNTG